MRSRFSHTEVPSGEHRSTEREIRATRQAKNWQRKKQYLIIYGFALLVFLAFLYLVTRDRGAAEGGESAFAPSPLAATTRG